MPNGEKPRDGSHDCSPGQYGQPAGAVRPSPMLFSFLLFILHRPFPLSAWAFTNATSPSHERRFQSREQAEANAHPGTYSLFNHSIHSMWRHIGRNVERLWKRCRQSGRHGGIHSVQKNEGAQQLCAQPNVFRMSSRVHYVVDFFFVDPKPAHPWSAASDISTSSATP